MEFLQESQSKDHELFERLADKKAEREREREILKVKNLMFDAIKEIAKILKGDS